MGSGEPASATDTPRQVCRVRLDGEQSTRSGRYPRAASQAPAAAASACPRWVGAPLYVALGWVAVPVLPQLLAHGGPAALVLLLAGGVLYTLGAVCYALRRPRGWPGTFGHHEFFHACTLVAAICHQVAVYFVLYR